MTDSVGYFIKEALWSFAILLLCGAAGFGPLLLFKRLIRFHLLASPLAGLLLINTITLGIYFALHVNYETAAITAAALCLIASAVLWVLDRHALSTKDVAIPIAVLGIVTVCFVSLGDIAAIRNGEPSIMYFHGTDHLGYANVADWMKDHIAWPVNNIPGSDAPRADPAHPYESLPNLEPNSEARTGAFALLALIGLARQLPSTFAYDPASGLYLSAAVVGVAAVFARSWLTFAVLALGLAFSSWYEFLHTGFFSKATAYPATVFTLGLFLVSRSTRDLRVVLIILMLCAASALLLSGLITAAIFAGFGGSAILFSSLFEKSVDWDQTAKLVMCMFVSVLAGGFFVHPMSSFSFGAVGFPAAYVATRSLDLEGWTAATGLADTTLFAMVAASLLATICGAWIALWERAPDALALLITPAVVYAILLIFTPRTELLQLTGLLYPTTLCGFGLLLNGRSRALMIAALGCLILTAALRTPHAYAAARRYTSTEAIAAAYPKHEIDQIADIIGDQKALIDLKLHGAILMLVELGRRGLDLQWTADAWLVTVGAWRRWPLPRYEPPAALRIVTSDTKESGKLVYKGPHFAVMGNQE